MNQVISGERYRYLDLDGSISNEAYTIADQGDRAGIVTLVSDSGKTRRVNRHRLLPDNANLAVVVEASDKFNALCPRCGVATTIDRDATEVICPEHGVFALYWLGAKPMAIEAEQQIEAPPAAEPQPEPAATEHANGTPAEVDFAQLRAWELWTKSDIQFDHPQYAVRAHVLIAGNHKLCFNTYNGRLGKKAKPIDPEQVKSGGAGTYVVKDLQKERSRLQKAGYVRDGGAQAGGERDGGAQV